ncbi:MFS transporter [Baekduia sp.]|jgi:EmrB/QacA subfamily drug resistance transporter|uniref:MFS transporter n=1 Tax=Baekduia sp. TaxID=2600305 RepID=UPI002E098C37|nr:MFS transporter [Baekduia sp.]
MSSSSPAQEAPTRHWLLVVVVVCLAQFMVVLDATITNVALPAIQSDLHFSPSDLQWVVNAYMLVFGGFLLLGGRAGDLLGRRRLFVAGISVFTLASLLDAVATSPGMLVGARALQGLGAALVSPAALSIITTTVPEGPDRTKALGAFAAISGGGGAVGLLLGGFLVDALSWQWVFLINLPVGLATLALALRVVPESRAGDRAGGFDLAGATLVTAGTVLLTYTIVKAQQFGWTSGRTLGLGLGAVALLGAFGIVQTRRAAPLVRLSIFRVRTLAIANAATVLLMGGMYALFYFGSLYFQQIKGDNALETGLAFLPMTVGIITGSVLSQRLLARFGVKAVLAGGLGIGTLGLLWMTMLTPDSSYVGGFLPGVVLLALGIGNAFVPLTLIATGGVAPDDQGLASGLFNTSQQIGGALGLAILTTVANSATDGAGGTGADALVHGYTTAFAVGAGLLALGAGVVTVLLRSREADASAAAAEGVEALVVA